MPKEPHRIAVVTETYPPEINGVATTISTMVRLLRERSHVVQVIRPRQGEPESPKDRLLTSDTQLPGMGILLYPELRFGLYAKRRLLKAWSENRPDVVHVVTEGLLGLSAVQAARRLTIPVASDFHTNFSSYSQYYHLGLFETLIERYLRWFHNRTDCTLVPTRRLKDVMVRRGYRKVEVVGRGVDTQLFSPAQRDQDLRDRWGVGETDLAVLYVGRLAAEKNTELVLLRQISDYC